MSGQNPADPVAARARELALALTGRLSVTGTSQEAGFAGQLCRLIGEHPYFRENPHHLVRQPVPGGEHPRENVFALIRGSGTATVVLAGHFDVVPVEDYGELASLAGTPEALTPEIIEKLRGSSANALALDDLASGRFLPGRGLLDMKSGLAAGLTVLERFAQAPERQGNLLFIATPDEENQSDGMRAAATALPGFLKEHGLKGSLGINLDALSDQGDGSEGRLVAFGCIGKQLLSALVIGKEAHACYPLDGVNAAYLAAELATAFEFAPELGQETDGALASPPTLLGARDLKDIYNVTTPGQAWLTWNVLTQTRTARETLDTASELARQAVEAAKQRLAQRAARLTNGVRLSGAWDEIDVLTFAELRAETIAANPGFEEEFDGLAARLAGDASISAPAMACRLNRALWEASRRTGPAIVFGFASMPYPAVGFPADEPGRALAEKVRAAVAEVAVETGSDIRTTAFLPVIVDMSFLGQYDRGELATVAANFPGWNQAVGWDIEQPAPSLPMLNIGPWGRDYHHWLERVETDYAFRVLPRLIETVALRVLDT